MQIASSLMAPSSMEGFGLPVAEGLFCGSRVVCSDIPAFREIGGEACHYFDLHAESGSAAMVAAICDALQNQSGRQNDLTDSFLEHVAREYAALYVAAKRRRFRHGGKMNEKTSMVG